MRQWYCHIGGQQYGPVGEEQFRAWIAEGRIRPDTYVWTEGMAQWQPAASVPGLFGPGVMPTARAQTSVPPSGGTGGRMGIFQVYSRSWALMSGRWGVAIGFCLLIFLMFLASAVLYCIGGPLWFMIFLAGPFALSAAIFFLTYIRGGQVRVGMMWDGFRNYGAALGAFLLPYLLAILWTLLGALPGLLVMGIGLIPLIESGGRLSGKVIAPLWGGGVLAWIGAAVMSSWAFTRYSQTLFLLADNPSMGVLNAINRSIAIMRGHKLRLWGMLFLLWLALVAVMFPLSLLMGMLVRAMGPAAFALMWFFNFAVQVLLVIFGYPFVGVCMAVFHDDLAPPAQPAVAPGPTGGLPVPAPSPEAGQDIRAQHQGGALTQPDEYA
ncbi:MAG: DUF975 family protein [Planctomycetota bacterium]|jgi:uncharacterized membrane protein